MKRKCTVSWFACLNVTFTHDKTFLYVFCRFGFLHVLTVGSDGHGHGNTRPSEADPRPAEQTGSRVEPNRKSAVTNCQTLSSDISPCSDSVSKSPIDLPPSPKLLLSAFTCIPPPCLSSGITCLSSLLLPFSHSTCATGNSRCTLRSTAKERRTLMEMEWPSG